MHQTIHAVLLAAFAVTAVAAEPPKFKELPPPPEAPRDYRPAGKTPKVSEENVPEPEVVITTRGEDRREEYRLGGRLYMIKVTPKVGKPYYLVDNEGRGEFLRSELQPSVKPPMWILKEF